MNRNDCGTCIKEDAENAPEQTPEEQAVRRGDMDPVHLTQSAPGEGVRTEAPLPATKITATIEFEPKR